MTNINVLRDDLLFDLFNWKEAFTVIEASFKEKSSGSFKDYAKYYIESNTGRLVITPGAFELT